MSEEKESTSRCLRTGDWFVATKEHVKANWMGGEGGKYFRCGFCGHGFAVGEKVKWLYTNDMPHAGGNPLVCESCGLADKDALRNRWKRTCLEAKEKFWFFTRRD